MNARLIDRVETGIEATAAALFGGAVAYAVYSCLGSAALRPQYSAAGGIVAFLLCLRVIRAMAERKTDMPIPVFNVRDLEPEFDELVLSDSDRLDSGELVLTDADRLDSDELLLTDAQRVPEEPLALDDILAELGPESRVVRLFDPKSMPTAGQLKTRIDDHLGEGRRPAAPSDASQALSEALAQLRRSLR